MKLCIFGSTGKLGRELVREALARGHYVTAFARDPSKFIQADTKTVVVKGDISDTASIDKAVSVADAVISALNAGNSTDFPLDNGIDNIINSMIKYGKSRFIASSPVPGVESPDDVINFKFYLICGLIKTMLNIFAGKQLDELIKSGRIVQESPLDWTLVRIFPTDRPKKEAVKAGYIGPEMGLTVTRADAASFMIDIIEDAKTFRKTLFLCN